MTFHQRIINGDGLDVVMRLPADVVIVTDPPYNQGMDYADGDGDRLSPNAYADLLAIACRPPAVMINYPDAVFRHAVHTSMLPTRTVSWVYNANTPRQHRMVAWFGCTPDFSSGGEYKNPTDRRVQARIAMGETARLYDWWQVELVKNVSAEKTGHPCQIPVEVMRRILSTTPGARFCDPFMGSGSTLVAARQLGVDCVGVERSPQYCTIARGRLESVATPLLDIVSSNGGLF